MYIHTIRQVAEKHEYNKDLHLVFVDFKQTYNLISRKELWKTMKIFGIPQKYLTLVKICNSNTNLKVHSGKKCQQNLKYRLFFARTMHYHQCYLT